MHRNSQKRFQIPSHVYFLTVKTHQGFPYSQEKVLCELFMEELRLCQELKKFELFAFCLNLDHFHLLLRPGVMANISEIMHFLKRNFSRDANKIILGFDYNEGDIPKCRRSNGIDKYDRIGDDMDRRLRIYRFKFLQKHPSNSFPQFKWQKSFHDHIIRGDKDFEKHFDYTVHNFRKHNLPEDWKYSSENFPELIVNF